MRKIFQKWSLGGVLGLILLSVSVSTSCMQGKGQGQADAQTEMLFRCLTRFMHVILTTRNFTLPKAGFTIWRTIASNRGDVLKRH